MDKKSRWQKITADQKASGLSAKHYCLERNLNLSTFNYWKAKVSFEPPSKSLATFLPVRLENTDIGFTVKFSPGQMTFETEPNPTWFAKVLKEMGREECQ